MAKPKPLNIDFAKLAKAEMEMGDYQPLVQLWLISDMLEDLHTKGTISDIEAVLMDTINYWMPVKEGKLSLDAINAITEKGPMDTISIPLPYFRVLMSGFEDYFLHRGEKSLAKSFGLEARTKGAGKSVEKMANIVRDIRLCAAYIYFKGQADVSGETISDDDAISEVIKQFDPKEEWLTFDVVNNARRTFKDSFLEKLSAL